MGLISRVSSRTYRENKMSATAIELNAKNIEIVHSHCAASYNKSPLEVAIMNGNFDWIREMFEKNNMTADPIVPEEEHGEGEEPVDVECKLSPLQLAIEWGSVEICRILIEYGAKLEVVDVDDVANSEIKTIIEEMNEGTLVNV